MVRGDDRNVPDATRWGERATFEPTSGPRAQSSTPKSEACAGGEDLKTDTRAILSAPILLEVRRAHCPHSQAHECRGICPLFITLAAPAHAQARAHVHMHIACCTLSNPDHDRYFLVITRYISPLPLFITQNICPLVNTPLGSNNFEM